MDLVYSLKRKKNTEELHLFEGVMTSVDTCSVGHKSICEGMLNSESDKIIFACQDENYARVKCATFGRDVCGTCVSHLYTTK